jgi:serine/threonine protein kinase
VRIEKVNPESIFEIICQIGEGGTSSVFKAVNKKSGQIVGLKNIKISNQDIREKAINEIAIMQLSQHPNIVQYYLCYEYSG